MNRLNIVRLFILIGMLTLMSCGRNTIVLRYNLANIDVYGCKNSISLVALDDKRNSKAIGRSSKGIIFYTSSSVAEWISRALYQELKKSGCKVDYHDKKYAFDTDYVITGSFSEAYIKQGSLSEYLATMKINLEITKGEKSTLKKSFFIKMTKKTLPSPGVNKKMLMQLLQGAMKEIIPVISEHIKTNG